MTAAKVFQFIGVSLIPIALTLLIYIGFKHAEKYLIKDKENLPKIFSTEKNRWWFKQIVAGILLGGFSIASYFLGIEVKSYISGTSTIHVGISTFFPVVGGLVFGWPTAIISTFIATIFRICMPSFVRWATVTACLVGGIMVSLASKFLLHNKRSKWYFALFTGIFVETINMFLIFIFNLSKISDVYQTVKQFDLICVLCNGGVACFSCLFIQLFEKEHVVIHFKKDKRINTKVQSLLVLICAIGLLAVSTSTYVVTYADAFDNSERELYNASFDMHKDFITMKSFISPVKCADRHFVTDQGFCLVVAGKYIDILQDEPKGAKYGPFNKGELVGVPESLKKQGIELKTPFAFDDGSDIESLNANLLSETYDDCTFYYQFKNLCGKNYLVTFSTEMNGHEGTGSDPDIFFVLVLIPHDEIQISAGISYRVVIYLNLITFIILFAILNNIINKRIIKNLKTIDSTLERIMDGNLNEEIILKNSYKEFETLSNNINLTVGALKNYAEEIERQMESELKVARDIQVGSLPTEFPNEKEYNLYALMNTAKEVGGDFYDYIKMNNGRILIINADVSGKGVPAAMFMMRAKTLFKSLASTTTNLGEIVYKVNNELCEDNEKDMFVTAWVGIFNPETGELNYVNAGHTVPLIKRNGKFEQFVNKHNVVLAAIPNSKYEVETIYLEPGQEIFVYTDGVTEAINSKTEMYGINRLIDVANNTNYFNSKQLLVNISDDIAKFANGVEQFDDITMVMLIYTGKQELNPENTLTLIAKPVSTTVAINYVESVLASRELNQKFIARISIVIDELFANIAFYAYPKGKEGNATVTIDTRDDMLRIRLIDGGTPFDPTAKEDPDVTASIDDRKRGGLGIFIVKNTMDDVRYEYTNFQNILYLDKKIKPEDKIQKKEDKKDVIKEGE